MPKFAEAKINLTGNVPRISPNLASKIKWNLTKY